MTSQPRTRSTEENKAAIKVFIEQAMKVTFLLLTCFIALIAFQGRSIINNQNAAAQDRSSHERRITAIETSLYSAIDAAKDRRSLHESIAKLRDWIEVKYPPKWLQDDVNDLKMELKLIREDVAECRNAIAASCATDPLHLSP